MLVEIVLLEFFCLLVICNVGVYEEFNKSYEVLFGVVFVELFIEILCGIWGVWYEDLCFIFVD